MIKRRVFISSPGDDYMNETQRKLVHSVLSLFSDAGFEPQRFLYSGLPASLGWNFQTIDEVMRRCVGAVIIAFPRWSLVSSSNDPVIHLTEYNHYEGAVANT